MHITGLIAEFNPFHNGHSYILQKAHEHTDGIIVIMSGSFVQRGDVAVTDKWKRAETALKNGADLVIELPLIYSLNTAQKFAYGAVETLNKCGVVNSLVFGSENGDISSLKKAAELLENESEDISSSIVQYMANGMNYPSARSKAYEGIIDDEILKNPNNILAVEYLRAILYTNSQISPLTIERTNDFHSLRTDNDIISATAVRRLVFENKDISPFVPESDFDIYNTSLLDNAVCAFLRLTDTQRLKEINDVSEGLENRIISAAKAAHTIDALAEMIKTKRYTMSRIRRVIFSAVLGLTKDLCSLSPSYIRVLGMNSTGMKILKEMKKYAELPLIVKAADFESNMIFNAETRATDLAALSCENSKKRTGGKDYTSSPVIIKNT